MNHILLPAEARRIVQNPIPDAVLKGLKHVIENALLTTNTEVGGVERLTVKFSRVRLLDAVVQYFKVELYEEGFANPAAQELHARFAALRKLGLDEVITKFNDTMVTDHSGADAAFCTIDDDAVRELELVILNRGWLDRIKEPYSKAGWTVVVWTPDGDFLTVKGQRYDNPTYTFSCER